jgi:hypothetical protein
VRFANAGSDATFNLQFRDKAGRPCDSAGEVLTRSLIPAPYSLGL